MPSSTDKTSTTSSQSSTTPWQPQADALTQAFNNATTAYGQSSTAQAPTDFTAQFSPEELSAFRSMIGFGNDTGTPNNQAANGTTLSNAGVAGTTGSLSGFAGYDPSAGNNPADIIASANAYAAGQDIPSQVKLAMQGANEQARDVTMPGIEQHAAGTGNTNSTRTGIAQGLVQRGLAEQSANLEGTLRSQAFQNGLTLAQQQAQNNNTAKLAALSGQGAVGTAASGAGNTAQNSSIANMIQKLSAGATGGAGLTAADQAQLTNALQKYQSGVTSPYDSLNGLMQILRGNYGSNTTSTGTGTDHTETTASPLSVAGGILGAGTSLFGSGGFNILGSLGKGMLSS